MTHWTAAPGEVYCVNCGLTWDMHIATLVPPAKCQTLPRLYTETRCSQCGMEIRWLREHGCPESRGGCGRPRIPGTNNPNHNVGNPGVGPDGVFRGSND